MANTARGETQSLAYSQYFSFAGKPLLVRSNSLAILDYASSFFAQWGSQEVLKHPSAELKLMLREDSSGSAEDAPWFRGRGNFALARFTRADSVWFNLRTRQVFGYFSMAVSSDTIRWQKDILPTISGILAPVIGVVPVHAACVAKGDFGVLLAGRSGTGKLTLAITLAQRGFGYLADDWTYMAECTTGVGAWSVPVPVKLLPDATLYFPELASYACAQSLNGEIAYEVSPEECFGVSRRHSCSVKCIVLLERGAQQGCRIAPVSATEAIGQLHAEIEPLMGPLAAAYLAQVSLLQRCSNAVGLRVSFNASPGEVACALDCALADLLTQSSKGIGLDN